MSSNEATEKVGIAVTYDSEVLLGTTRVIILDQLKNERECRLSLHVASQCNFMTEKLANKLKLNHEKVSVPVSGLGQLRTPIYYKVKAKI